MIKIKALRRPLEHNTLVRDLCLFLTQVTGDEVAPNCIMFPVHRELYYFWGKNRTWEVEEIVENGRIEYVRIKVDDPKIESYIALRFSKN